MLRFRSSQGLARSNFCGLRELSLCGLCVKWIHVERSTNPETYWNEHELPEKFLTFTAILGITNNDN